MKAIDYITLEEQYGAHNYQPLDVVLANGQGIWVYDVDGKKYMDCLSAYSAVNQGHCHPRIVKAMIEQAQKLTLTSRAFRNDTLGPFLKKIHELTGYEMTLPMNSGAEAVETALKAVRKWGYRVKQIEPDQAEIIVCEGNFHGRTIAIVGFSSEEQYKQDFGPFPAGFVSIPFGDARALEAAITPNTVGFLVEPIQGEGGVIVPAPGFLKKAREICNRHNVLFVADEIQTGLGRTGKLFACDHEEIQPDVMIIGKALSGGVYPVSAVLASREILGLFRPGDHGSTFGGNPLGAAVATEALTVLTDERLIENAREIGQYFQERLAEIPSPYIEEVRGRGLLIGVELKPEARGARRFCEALLDKGILCKETHENVIRFAPPLVIERDEVDWAVEQVTNVLNMD
jgi:ornithine--oxo-acid transaminase